MLITSIILIIIGGVLIWLGLFNEEIWFPLIGGLIFLSGAISLCIIHQMTLMTTLAMIPIMLVIVFLIMAFISFTIALFLV